MELIDTHCHLDLAVFEPDREQVLQRCRQAGLSDIVIPGISAAAWPQLLALCDSDRGLHPALGLHPVFIDQHRPADLDALARRLDTARPDPTRVVAVGEIGLDFFVEGHDRAAQITLVEAQCALAAERRLPVLLHVRKAHDPMLALLRGAGLPGGIAHAFNGSLQQARRYIELGFCLGFGGMLTFERSRRLRELARQLPLDALVLETDAPDMTVAAHRGERNSPEYLPDVATALAQLRGISVDEVAAATSANARRVLALAA